MAHTGPFRKRVDAGPVRKFIFVPQQNNIIGSLRRTRLRPGPGPRPWEILAAKEGKNLTFLTRLISSARAELSRDERSSRRENPCRQRRPRRRSSPSRLPFVCQCRPGGPFLLVPSSLSSQSAWPRSSTSTVTSPPRRGSRFDRKDAGVCAQSRTSVLMRVPCFFILIILIFFNLCVDLGRGGLGGGPGGSDLRSEGQECGFAEQVWTS